MSDQDNFFRGASLGMNAVQAGIQAKQNRTNLAERSRQFDLSYRLNVQQQKLNERRFEEQLEGYELDQKIQLQTLKKNKALMKRADETLERRNAFEPKEQEWYTKAQDWNGYSPFPTIPLDAPADARKEMLEFSNLRREQFTQNKVKQDYREGGIWMSIHHPAQVRMFDDRPPEYDYENYQRLKKIAALEAAQKVIEDKRAEAKQKHEYAKELKMLGLPTKEAQAAKARQEYLLELQDKYTTEENDGSFTMNHARVEFLMNQYDTFGKTGEVIETTNLNLGGFGPKQADALGKAYSSQEGGTFPAQ